MQVDIINTAKVLKASKGNSVSKDSKSGEFGKFLDDIEKNGNGSTVQLLAAYGLLIPAFQQNTADCSANGGKGALQDGTGNSTPAVSGDASNQALCAGTLKMSPQGLAIAGTLLDKDDAAAVAAKKNLGDETSAAQTVQGAAVNVKDTDLKAAPTAAAVPVPEAGQAENTFQLPQDADVLSVQSGKALKAAPDARADLAGKTLQTAKPEAGAVTVAEPSSNLPVQNVQTAENSPAVNAGTNTALQTPVNGASAAPVKPADAEKDLTGADGVKASEGAKTAVQSSDTALLTPVRSQSRGQEPGTAQQGGEGSREDSTKDHNGTDAVQSAFAAPQTVASGTKGTALQASRADVANQVSDAVKQAVDSGRTEVRLHLSPEDLGGISVKIVSQGGVISLQIATDSQHTGQLLATGMDELAKAMQNQGITMGKTDVTYAGTGGFGTATSQQQQQNWQGPDRTTPKWVSVVHPLNTEREVSSTAQTLGGSGLSILA